MKLTMPVILSQNLSKFVGVLGHLRELEIYHI